MQKLSYMNFKLTNYSLFGFCGNHGDGKSINKFIECQNWTIFVSSQASKYWCKINKRMKWFVFEFNKNFDFWKDFFFIKIFLNYLRILSYMIHIVIQTHPYNFKQAFMLWFSWGWNFLLYWFWIINFYYRVSFNDIFNISKLN